MGLVAGSGGGGNMGGGYQLAPNPRPSLMPVKGIPGRIGIIGYADPAQQPISLSMQTIPDPPVIAIANVPVTTQQGQGDNSSLLFYVALAVVAYLVLKG